MLTLGLSFFIGLSVETMVPIASLAAVASLYSVAIVAVHVRFRRLFFGSHRESLLIGQAELVMTCELSTTQMLHDWTVAMTAQSLSKNTIRERVRVITQVEAQTQISPQVLSPADITMWLSTLPTPITRHCYYVHLRAWFRWLVANDLRQDDPMIKVVAPKRPKYEPRPITDAQLRAALGQDSLRHSTRTRIILAAFAGLRVHEIAKIQGQDLDRVTGLLQVLGKGNKQSIVPVHPIILTEAKTYPLRGWWFPSRTNRGDHVDSKAVAQSIVDAFARVGITMTSHQLRHYFATALLEGGADARVVQTLMRHENLSTTALYMGVSVKQQKAALDALLMPNAFTQFLF